MSISVDETNLLFGRLEARGWRREADSITAPQGTMGLLFGALHFETVCEMRERMRGRLERILANRESSLDAQAWQHSFDDTRSLVECLDGWEVAWGKIAGPDIWAAPK